MLVVQLETSKLEYVNTEVPIKLAKPSFSIVRLHSKTKRSFIKNKK